MEVGAVRVSLAWDAQMSSVYRRGTDRCCSFAQAAREEIRLAGSDVAG